MVMASIAGSVMFALVRPARAAPAGPLAIEVAAERDELIDGEAVVFDLRVINHSPEAIVFLPNVARLRVEGEGARFVERPPVPGPRTVPWFDARVLAPGGTFSHHVVGLADRSREWQLPPGSYDVTVVYEPTRESFEGYEGAEGSRWFGSLSSLPLSIRIVPRPAQRPSVGGEPGRVESVKLTRPPPSLEEMREKMVEDILAGHGGKEIAAGVAAGDSLTTESAFIALSRAKDATELDRATGLLHGSPQRDRVVAAILDRLRTGGDERVVLILNHLRAYSTPTVTEALIGILRDPSAEVSRAASAVLGGSPESAVRGALWKLVDDPSAPGSAYAVPALAQCLDPNAEVLIVNQFGRRERLYKEQALRAMGLYGSPRILAWMVGVAKNDPDAGIRSQALDALEAYARRQPQPR